MSCEARAYIVKSYPNLDFQLHVATLDLGVLPERIDNLFRDIDKNDIVNFYTQHKSETRGHMTKRYRDNYGNPLRVADLDDILPAVKEETDWEDCGFIFKDVLVSLRKHVNKKMKFLIFLEEY